MFQVMASESVEEDVKHTQAARLTKSHRKNNYVSPAKDAVPVLEISIPDSRFGKALVQISRQITGEELSNLRLFMVAHKSIRAVDVERLKNPGDFLMHLLKRNFYSEGDTAFLEEILTEVGRKDLCKMLPRPQRDLSLDGPGAPLPDSDTEQTDTPSVEGWMSVDGSLERDEEPMISSQNSISDDEKLQILQDEQGIL